MAATPFGWNYVHESAHHISAQSMVTPNSHRASETEPTPSIHTSPSGDHLAESETATTELSINTINAVHKKEVEVDVASKFELSPTLPPGLIPHLADLNLPPGTDAFAIDDVLSQDECELLLAASESAGLTFWDTTRSNPRKDYRNADTVEVPNTTLAHVLWSRIGHLCPPVITISPESSKEREQSDLRGEWYGVGTNEKNLFARYQHGGHFSPHTDGYSIVDFNHRSMYTLLIYLNTCEGGGGTRFYASTQVSSLKADAEGRFTGQSEHEIATVKAVAGRALCFFHNILHEGVAVQPGHSKYIIRSDVMYERRPKICDLPADREAFRLYQQADELSAQGKVQESMQLYRKCVRMSPALAAVYGL
eukprot:m.151489 g.151489  ORF g.151489 m.151489 type:complete len:365 (-) comp30763_c0_seq1:248-1342(-)